jgi:hypothetical protein
VAIASDGRVAHGGGALERAHPSRSRFSPHCLDAVALDVCKQVGSPESDRLANLDSGNAAFLP